MRVTPQRLKSIACLALIVLLCWPRRRTPSGCGASPTASWARASPWSCGRTIRPKAERAIDAVLDEMRHIDDSMSTYKPTSEVSQVNAKAADGPMHISKELFDLLVTAKEYSVLTDGAFDITYASVGYLYDFPQARPSGRSANRQGAAGGQLPARAARPEESDRAVLAEGRAHRSRRHRQGLLGRPRHRCA